MTLIQLHFTPKIEVEKDKILKNICIYMCICMIDI